MRMRIAEINEDAVAHIFGDEPVEAAHDLSDTFLIARDDLAQVLRVHAGGERRRTDQVAEHEGDLTTLRGVPRPVDCRKSVGLRHFRARVSAQNGYGGEQLTAVPDDADSQILQVRSEEPRL